ncbi:hypothetical protein AEAC466_04565 [Asticcacaulis sp. AC466]|uniref:DUF2800 domain-containing protein n=1 Tax=Asticcacaulis sp. AC466 TaxID=1282362 RepID=UPI0003C3F55D|nr:DUF2800 domain-containing protein [Asticcacaulis sp. AC466]ESQ85442.1 hypothetical protein AEAC466_04565 [Asticcacaulis sp. AC466]
MAAHARIGPSSLKRTINCRGSIRELEKLTRTSNDAADEGSCLHTFCEEVLNSEGLLEPFDLIGKTYEHNGYNLTITLDHAEHAINGIDWIRQQPGELLVEQRVSLEPWMPDQFGTCDVAILDDDLCIIFDWKWGSGVPVKVEDNPQLKAYALGFLHTVLRPRGQEPSTFRLIIEQPRNAKGGRYYEHWDISLEDLLEFGELLKEVYADVMSGTAPCVAGEWCKETFCDVMKTEQGCPAYNRMMIDLLGPEFDDDDLDLEDPDLITPERRGRIVKWAAEIRAWLAKLHEDSIDAAYAGRTDPGLKLVPGQKGDRYFTDEEEAELILGAALGAQAFTFKLKSPAQAEKDLKPGRKKVGNKTAWSALTELIGQDEGKPVLVADSDPRPALKPLRDYFDDDDDASTFSLDD